MSIHTKLALKFLAREAWALTKAIALVCLVMVVIQAL